MLPAIYLNTGGTPLILLFRLLRSLEASRLRLEAAGGHVVALLCLQDDQQEKQVQRMLQAPKEQPTPLLARLENLNLVLQVDLVELLFVLCQRLAGAEACLQGARAGQRASRAPRGKQGQLRR